MICQVRQQFFPKSNWILFLLLLVRDPGKKKLEYIDKIIVNYPKINKILTIVSQNQY
jgi:hypothetical protein